METTIEWTATLLPDGTLVPGYSFNPWIGCTKVSPACTFCYAERQNLRYGKDLWGKGKERQRTSKNYWKSPFAWDRKAAALGWRLKVFGGSWCDVFDPEVRPEWRLDYLELIVATPNLNWLLLTKRPELVLELMDERPLPANVWLGTSVEDQKRADIRIPALLKVPATKHFLSVEPLLEAVELGELTDWVIVGGESGRKCRSMKMEWARSVHDQCRASAIPFFMKQLGGYPDKRHKLTDFPIDLRIREWPQETPIIGKIPR